MLAVVTRCGSCLEPFEESLTSRPGLKTPRGSKSIARRDVAALDRFGGLACQTMEAGPDVQRAWQVLPGCPDVGLMVIEQQATDGESAAESCQKQAVSRDQVWSLDMAAQDGDLMPEGQQLEIRASGSWQAQVGPCANDLNEEGSS
jgi:hypothetical protein